ncbi:MAG: site-2 protease family protein [Acidobacteria bacterium]|nr:site-2 protease family protein [Acidobacteriota bacterium]
MTPSITLGRLFGVAIGLHYSWLIIAALITLSLRTHFGATDPDWGPAVVWTTAIVTAALFFASIVVHELAHALVARARGVSVRSITLFALGGVATMENPSPDAKTEFWIAIAGPLASIAIGLGCYGLAASLGWAPDADVVPATAVLGWLGYINIALALFNLIPGFPLDGGRILRAVLWAQSGDAEQSTLNAARVGQAVAFGFIFLGVLRFFGGAGIGGLWIAFIGWFLLQAAQASYAQVAVVASLRGVRVRDIMNSDCVPVAADMPVQTLVDEHLLRTGQRCFVVGGPGRMLGLITPHEIKGLARDRWATTPLSDVMRAIGQLKAIASDAPAIEAMQMMGASDLNQLPVMTDGRFAGIVGRSHIVRLLQARAELNAPAIRHKTAAPPAGRDPASAGG